MMIFMIYLLGKFSFPLSYRDGATGANVPKKITLTRFRGYFSFIETLHEL